MVFGVTEAVALTPSTTSSTWPPAERMRSTGSRAPTAASPDHRADRAMFTETITVANEEAILGTNSTGDRSVGPPRTQAVDATAKPR